MAYGLKYWYETLHEDGKVIRLEIYKKGYTAGSMEIGDVVQGLSLNIGGSEDNIDAPVVSTSLVMTFADAYDHPDAEVKKYGNWAEFYTPDATMWKVVLLCRECSATRTLWGGYVTPDSYEEVLQYRGSITITVRDNIGHMQDFPFDYEGENLTFRELVEAAWAKIESPMSLTWGDGWLRCEDIPAPDTVLNAIAFDGKSWGEAVEEVLYSYGAVMRFVGDNTVHVCPLRDIAEYGGQTVSNSVAVFVTGATRMLTPAVKSIEEEAKYDIGSFEIAPVKASDFTGAYDITTVVGDSATPKLYGYYINETKPGNGWCNPNPNGTLFFNQHLYTFFDEGANDEQNMFLGCNKYRLNADVTAFGLGRYAEYSRYVLASNMSFNLTLGEAYSLLDGGVLRVIGSYQGYTHADVLVYVQQNGITQILQDDGTWGTTPNLVQVQFSGNSIEVPILLNDFRGSMCLVGIQIHGIYNKGAESSAACYAPVHSVSLSSYISLLATNRINTNYEDENNIIITRDPAFAPAIDIVPIPVIIENGIFAKVGDAYKPASAWAWAGGTPQQMAVYNHLQLLCFHAKPNNVLEGSIVNGDVTRMAHIWKFEGREHLLVAGRYDMLTGYIEGAILREFARYEHLWGDVGGTQLPTVEASSRSNAQESAASSAKNTTYEQTATVNINVGGGGGSSYLRDLLDVKVENATIGSILYWDGNEWIDRGLSGLLGDYATKQYVDKKDKEFSSTLSKILDWFTLEDGVLLTKYNLASEKEVSAKGINASQGGGTSYNRLDSWSAYDSSKAGYVLSALLGYDLHSRVTNLENAEVDLSDYYTKSETNSQIASAIGAIDLSPYATKEALNTLEGKHDALRNEFNALSNLLSSDTTDYINTWNEVVAFLDGYKDESDLATILSGMNADISSRLLTSTFDSWKADTYTPLANLVANHTTKLDSIDASITNINTRLEGVDKTIEDHIAEFIAFRANFEISDDLILVRKNFASTEEVSAKGINQGTGGGGGSSYSRLDTWDGYDNNKAGYVLSAGLGYGLKVAIDELEGYNLDSRVSAIENSYVSKDAGGVVNGGLVVSSLAIAGGSSSQFLKADGSLDSTSYLSMAGGNLYGNLVINGALAVTSNITFYESLTMKSEAGINFYDADNFLRGILLPSSENNYALSWYDTTAWRTIWHSGNFNPSDYLPTSGGTINGDLAVVRSDFYSHAIQIGTSDGYGFLIYNGQADAWYVSDRNYYNAYAILNAANFSLYALPITGGAVNGAIRTYGRVILDANQALEFVGDDNVSRLLFPYAAANYELSYHNGDGWNTILHSGNVGDYAGIYLNNETFDLNESRNVFRAGKLFGSPNAANEFASYRGFLEYGAVGYVAQFNSDGQNNLFYRWCENGTWLPWKTIAFTDSDITGNAATATIAESARTLLSAENTNLFFTYPNLMSWSLGFPSYHGYIDGADIAFRYGYSYTTAMLINSSGNVGIGIDSPQYKLHVDGTGYFSGALTANDGLTVNGILTVGGASIHPTANNPYFQLYQNNKYWYWQADDSYTYIGGTMTKALRIDQEGNTLIRGSLGVDALLTASNGLTVSKGISATDGIVSDWITAANITANTSASIAALTVSGLSTFTGGVVTNDISGNGQSLYLGNASNNAFIKVREDMVGSSSMWSIPRDGKATFTSLTTPTLSVTGSATIASVTIDAGNATLSNLTVNTVATLKQLVVGIDGMSCNAPATFNDFIYGSSITPRTDNYYVLGNNNYKWYAVTAYNVNVHDAITIEAGKELRFKDDNGVVHTLKYDSTKQAFVFDGNVNATGEMSAKKLNA